MTDETPRATDRTFQDTAHVLTMVYTGISAIWPEVTPDEFRRTALGIADKHGGPFLSVEDFIDDIITAIHDKYGPPIPALILLAQLNTPPLPFNVGGNPCN
jgi:hypothetical protein